MIEEFHDLQDEAKRHNWPPMSDTTMAILILAEQVRDLQRMDFDDLAGVLADKIADRLSPELHSAASNVGS